MKNTERQKFEEHWQEAFEGSEMTPSDSVWSNIDLKLDNEKMKRSVVYYQRLAAGTVLFALLIGIGGVRYLNNSDEKKMALKQNSDNAKTKNADQHLSNDKSTSENASIVGSNETQVAKQLTKEFSSGNHSLKNNSNEVGQIYHSAQESRPNTITSIDNKNQKIHFVKEESSRAIANQSFESLGYYNSAHLSQTQLPMVSSKKKEESKIESVYTTSILPVEIYNEKETKQKKKKSEDLWLSFGAATGSYNPGSASSSPQTMNTSLVNSSYVSQAPQSSRSSVGTAYSMGISVGKKIADRWIIQTGINYLSQAINYTSNFATQSSTNQLKASVADYASQNSAPVSITQPYKINSNTEFVSIPMLAGYLLIDRKIGLQLNAGVASDIFLKNTLKDQSGQSAKYSQGSGSDSPYRPFNWAGLASTELSYKMSRQYRISIMPGFRYSFQPTLKSQSGVNANPLVLDVGFRFRYIFD